MLLVPLSLGALLRLSNNQIKMTLGNLGLDSSRTRKKKGRQSFKVGLYHSVCARVCAWVYLGDCALSALEMGFFIISNGEERGGKG